MGWRRWWWTRQCRENRAEVLRCVGCYRLSDAFTVQANLNNLLDKKYYAQIYGYGAWGEPRSGSVSFTWSF